MSSRNVVLSATKKPSLFRGQMARPVFFCAGWEVPPKKNGGFLRIGGNPFFQMPCPMRIFQCHVRKFRIDPNLPRTRIHPASSIIIHHPSIIPSIWSNYSDREREIPLFQGISRLVKYYYIWPAPSFESSHKFLVGLFGIFHLFCSGG